MEKLKFMAKGQKLIRLEIKPIYSGVRNYMEAEFILNHSWYNITPLVAQFKKNEKIFHITLNNGKCTVPWEVLENAGTIEISLTGGNLLVTNTVKVTVNDSGAEGGLVPTEASNSLYSEIMAKLNSIEEDWLNCKSLLAEYEQNISDSETAVENKITDFETKSDELSRKISEINVLAEKCKSDSQTVQALYEEVKEKIENAKKAIDTLVEKITLAESTKTSLEESISKGNNTKAVLDSTITRAENIKAELKLEDCIAENARAEKNIEQLESDNFNAEEILYGVEDLKKYTGYSENGECFFAKFDTTTGTVVECLDREIRKADFSKGLNGMKVNAIGKYAFAGCGNLAEIELGTDITSIGKNAFSGSGLTEDIVIPPYVTNIENGAFNDIESKIYNLSDVEITEGTHCNNNNIGETVTQGSLGNNVTYALVGKYFIVKGTGFMDFNKISDYSEYITSIKKVYIKNGVTAICRSMFDGCSNLEKIEIPDGVTNISNLAFNGCSMLKEVKIPNSVTAIQSRAFTDCVSLKTAVLPIGLSVVSNSLFLKCTELSSVNIPKSVTTIEYSAFYMCKGLKEITIPDKVTTIGKGAFYGSGLTNVTIGSGIEEIEATAFGGTKDLTTITIKKSTDSIENAPWGATNAEIIWEE